MSVTFYAIQLDHKHLVDDNELDVNMSNVNAKTLLSTLGLGEDNLDRDPFSCEELVGTSDAESFLGRVLMAEAVSPEDEGIPVNQLPSEEGKARVFDGGRMPGYIQMRLSELRELAQWCNEHGFDVAWA